MFKEENMIETPKSKLRNDLRNGLRNGLNERERVRNWLYKKTEFDYKSKDFYINCRLIVRYIIIKEFKENDLPIIQSELYSYLVERLLFLGVPQDFLWDKEEWLNRMVKEEIANDTPLYDKDYIEVPVYIIEEIVSLQSALVRKALFGIVAHVLYRMIKRGNRNAVWFNVSPAKSDIIKKSNLQNLSKRKYYEILHILYEMGYIEVSKRIDGEAIKLTDKIFCRKEKYEKHEKYERGIENNTDNIGSTENRTIRGIWKKYDRNINLHIHIYSLDNLGKEIEQIRKELKIIKKKEDKIIKEERKKIKELEKRERKK